MTKFKISPTHVCRLLVYLLTVASVVIWICGVNNSANLILIPIVLFILISLAQVALGRAEGSFITYVIWNPILSLTKTVLVVLPLPFIIYPLDSVFDIVPIALLVALIVNLYLEIIFTINKAKATDENILGAQPKWLREAFKYISLASIVALIICFSFNDYLIVFLIVSIYLIFYILSYGLSVSKLNVFKVQFLAVFSLIKFALPIIIAWFTLKFYSVNSGTGEVSFINLPLIIWGVISFCDFAVSLTVTYFGVKRLIKK